MIRDSLGYILNGINRPQEALASLSQLDMEAVSKWTAVFSSWSIGRMITAYHMLGEYEQERQTLEKAKDLFPDRTWRTQEVRVLAALG